MTRLIVKNCCVVFLTVSLLVTIVSSATADGPWKARIIDIDTQEPLEGTVVLATWDKVIGYIADTTEVFHKAIEVVTDKDGYFEIPAYTPINVPLVSRIEGPNIWIFKPGYLILDGFGDYYLPDSAKEPIERQESIRGFEGSYKYTFRLAPGLVELPKVESRYHRKLQLDRPLISEEYMPNYIRLYRSERDFLGLK